jgi:hypothetical protein
MYTAKILRLSGDLPLVVEVIDTEENFERQPAAAEPRLGSCLVTLEKIRVLRYGHYAGWADRTANKPRVGVANSRPIWHAAVSRAVIWLPEPHNRTAPQVCAAHAASLKYLRYTSAA